MRAAHWPSSAWTCSVKYVCRGRIATRIYPCSVTIWPRSSLRARWIHNMVSSTSSEKGLPLPALATRKNQPVTTGPTNLFGRLRRRRVAFFAVFAILLILVYSVYQDDTSGSDILGLKKQFFKPSSTDSEAHSPMVNAIAQAGSGGQQADEHNVVPTDALRELQSSPATGKEGELGGGEVHAAGAAENVGKSLKPLQSDRILLLLQAVKQAGYTVPVDTAERAKDFSPATMQGFSESLRRIAKAGGGAVGGGGGVGAEANVAQTSKAIEEDARLYIQSHDQWLSKHRQESPLTVFSKSYCPFSRKAKALLRQMGAKFEVYEVDQRPDGFALQQALREVSGHRTFPTIFVRDRLIGGSDDLAHLESLGTLRGILEAAGVSINVGKVDPLE